MKRVYLILGPTAVGKSGFLKELSKTADISLISADSVQVYRGLDIGSAKPTAEERNVFPHYLIDIRSPFENFTVADFIREADAAVNEIFGCGRIPVISGGTAYYFKNFIFGLSNAPECDEDVREKIKKEEKEKGLAALYERLSRVDGVSAGRINPNDSYRIKRALEVYEQTGKPLSSFKVPGKPRSDYEFVLIGLYRERDEIRRRVRVRLDEMFKAGLANEVEGLRRQGITLANQCMHSIGYEEFFDPELKTADEIKEKIYTDTVHYAKRQMTFFRSLNGVQWFNPDELVGEKLKKVFSS